MNVTLWDTTMQNASKRFAPTIEIKHVIPKNKASRILIDRARGVPGNPITKKISVGSHVTIPGVTGRCLVVQWNGPLGNFSIDVLLPTGTIKEQVVRIVSVVSEPLECQDNVEL